MSKTDDLKKLLAEIKRQEDIYPWWPEAIKKDWRKLIMADKKKPAAVKIITIELDYDVYAEAEKDRITLEKEAGGQSVHQKRFYAEIIEGVYKRRNGEKKAK